MINRDFSIQLGAVRRRGRESARKRGQLPAAARARTIVALRRREVRRSGQMQSAAVRQWRHRWRQRDFRVAGSASRQRRRHAGQTRAAWTRHGSDSWQQAPLEPLVIERVQQDDDAERRRQFAEDEHVGPRERRRAPSWFRRDPRRQRYAKRDLRRHAA